MPASIRQCKDCGRRHDDMLEAIACDWEYGGKEAARATLVSHRMPADQIEAVLDRVWLQYVSSTRAN